MGTTGSTPATPSTERSKGHGGSKGTRKPVSTPAIPKHQPPSSSPALKKGPKNYVDMGIEEESEERFDQGEWGGKGGLSPEA
jgi:hypothetical protein